MASLPQSVAFDLCGEEPIPLSARRVRKFADSADFETHQRRSEELARIVEGEIIPRLMLVHQSGVASAPGSGSAIALGAETTEKFALYTLSSGHDSLLAIVGNLLQQGVPMEAIYLELLAPAARRLGDFWTNDEVSFADVTIALGRLQQVVRELSLHGPVEEGAAPQGRAALFAPAPGEQHTFGLVIIEEFFRRSGWRTWTELSGSPAEIVGAVQAHHFDLFGLTASSETHLDQISPLIMSVRRASRNRDINVMVGGLLFVERPELAAKVGADGTATDAREAVLKAEGAVRQLARR
ncbi:MAG: cobalamin B12-binding domain-containing protein [Hyphomonadaceae bacterium]|nr:cobalamin B12-binding domain-containing protein [Hyphomonadaceae bacterium]